MLQVDKFKISFVFFFPWLNQMYEKKYMILFMQKIPITVVLMTLNYFTVVPNISMQNQLEEERFRGPSNFTETYTRL